MIWNLLAPGPSASQALADWLRDRGPLGVISNAYELAPWAEFLAATDHYWWRKHRAAHDFAGRKFSMHIVTGIERVAQPAVNSGVLGIEVARILGATEVRLYGYDQHGTHFFGPYTNGLKNTTPDKRKLHAKQFEQWQRRFGKKLKVWNCTPGSALTIFEWGNSEDIFGTQAVTERTGT